MPRNQLAIVIIIDERLLSTLFNITYLINNAGANPIIHGSVRSIIVAAIVTATPFIYHPKFLGRSISLNRSYNATIAQYSLLTYKINKAAQP